jgi:GntR family transcriptional regulator
MVLSNRYSDRGGALPSEAALSLEFNATRNVVREALGLLREEGLIERQQGAGTFVAGRKLLHRFDILHGVADGYPDRRRRLRGELPTVALTPAPALVAQKLGLRAGEPCLRVDAWVCFDEVPFSLSTSYLLPELEEPLRDADFGGDWYELLEGLGWPISASAMGIEATVADDYVAPWLDVHVGAPLVLFTRFMATEDGRPVEYGFVRVRGDRIVLQVPLPRSTTSYDADPVVHVDPQELP